MTEAGNLQGRHDYDEPDFATIDTLFSLAEAHLFMQLVEMHDSQPGILPASKTYADMYRRVPDCSYNQAHQLELPLLSVSSKASLPSTFI